ncbi:hypothetical protein BMF94_2642 [Rhodotorula taiwanensis]|uniref:Uncharacterized protein n=1 Tax=Rhodotorula taiwanensis TaxID=741276 RepID=A0A2S5BCG4_9BASI|nr:hypothetical protein BMF94_2642 [Rhodotorula taiwanensis]
MQPNGRMYQAAGVRSKRSGAANIPTSCPQDTAGAGVFTSPGAAPMTMTWTLGWLHSWRARATIRGLLAAGAAEALEEVRKLKNMTITEIAAQQFSETKTVLSYAMENSNVMFDYGNEMIAQNVLRVLQMQRARREGCLDKLNRAAVLLVGKGAEKQLSECESIIKKIAQVSQKRRQARDDLKRDVESINERALGEVYSLQERFQANANKLVQRLEKASS